MIKKNVMNVSSEKSFKTNEELKIKLTAVKTVQIVKNINNN